MNSVHKVEEKTHHDINLCGCTEAFLFLSNIFDPICIGEVQYTLHIVPRITPIWLFILTNSHSIWGIVVVGSLSVLLPVARGEHLGDVGQHPLLQGHDGNLKEDREEKGDGQAAGEHEQDEERLGEKNVKKKQTENIFVHANHFVLVKDYSVKFTCNAVLL